MFCTRVACVCLVCLLLCKEEGSSPVSLQLLREGIWACMRWIDHVWSSKECVCCACDPNERLSAPSICFVCVLNVGSYLFI